MSTLAGEDQVAHVLNNGLVNFTEINLSENVASSYTLGLDTYIKSSTYSGISLHGTGVWTVKIDGGAFGDLNNNNEGDGNGLRINNIASGNNKITIGADGSLGGADQGFGTSAAFDLVNAGLIQGAFGGIVAFYDEDFSNINAAGKKISVDNKVDAIIAGEVHGVDNNTFATMTLKNAGLIFGGSDVYHDADLDDEDDTGYTGAAVVSNGALTFNNSATGEVYGNILTSWFGNKIENSGNVFGTIRGYVSNNNGLVDVDRDGLFNDAASGGAIQISALTPVVSTIINKGIITGVEDYGLNHQDTIDTEDDNYFQVAMNLSDGKDIVTNSGTIFGDVWLNGGDDTFTNTGFVRGYVDGWYGNNTVVNKSIIEYGVGGQDGNDKLDNKGEIHGNVRLRGGADTVTNSGEIWDEVDLGDGTNALTNKGIIFDNVYGGNGADTITNTGTIGTDGYVRNGDYIIGLGSGADKITNTGKILGFVDLGFGADVYVGSKNIDLLVDNSGADNYTLGDGADFIYFFGEDGQIDTADGGKGFDTASFTEMDQAVTVNLASNQLKIGATLNVIKNFERIFGSEFGDNLTGGLLRDQLFGGDGNDIINGGKGKDLLSGGEDADIFVYTALTDSTVGNAGRDLIDDFEQGIDHIKLDFVGINFIGTLLENTAFTGVAGEVRYITRGASVQVEGDVNGDRKADFAITLVDVVNLDSSDFIFA